MGIGSKPTGSRVMGVIATSPIAISRTRTSRIAAASSDASGSGLVGWGLGSCGEVICEATAARRVCGSFGVGRSGCDRAAGAPTVTTGASGRAQMTSATIVTTAAGTPTSGHSHQRPLERRTSSSADLTRAYIRGGGSCSTIRRAARSIAASKSSFCSGFTAAAPASPAFAATRAAPRRCATSTCRWAHQRSPPAPHTCAVRTQRGAAHRAAAQGASGSAA